MTAQKHTPDICERLRGVYRVPITDGLGATGGGEEPDNPNEFVRKFPSVPIQERAADLIDEMLEALREAEEYFDNRADADHDETGFVPNEEMKLLTVVRAAIAKATGQ